MNKILLAVAASAVLSSCAGSYNVQGTSNVSSLDGSKLYLKAIKDNELKDIDSCEVLHGTFQFEGTLDTVRMVNLFMDDASLMPLVLEKGEIRVRINNTEQTVGGTPMNDLLYDFLGKHRQLDNQLTELAHQQSRMMLDGIDEVTINQYLNAQVAKIAKEEDQLVTTFISDNFDNVLGPGIFMLITSRYSYPVLTPQIEHIMSNATAKFKNDPYVKDYYQTATENERRMQGLDDPANLSDTVVADSLPGGQ